MDSEPEPLTRSSIEAYVGIALAIVLTVFPMIWWLRIPLFILLCFVCVDFSRRSPVTLKYLPTYARTGLCILVFGLIVWAGVSNISKAWRQEHFPPEPVEYFKFWGPLDRNAKVIVSPPNTPILQGRAESALIVDTIKLKGYSAEYRLWAACFHWTGMKDPLDTENISHSQFFDITGGDVGIAIPWNSEYISEILTGRTGTAYWLLLLPKKVTNADFKTIRKALDAGGIKLEDHGGPP